jgi:hypothetical protein
MTHYAVEPKDLSVESYPIGASAEQGLGDTLDFGMFFRKVDCHLRTHCFLLFTG